MEKLKNWMKERHLPKTNLAYEIGVCYRSVYKWFDKGVIPTQHLKAVSNYTNGDLSIEDLIS